MFLKKRISFYIIPLVFIAICFSTSNAQDKLFTRQISYKDTLFQFQDRFIIKFTEKLTLGENELKSVQDYTLDYRNGILKLSKDLFARYSLDTVQLQKLTVSYDVLPYVFKDEYSGFDVTVERDTVSGDTLEIATQKSDLIEDIFSGTELEKSGSLFRGLTVGNNRDLSLNSGFRLQLNGRLSSDVEITAALTDEKTPIQPEGNTQKLQELDKVFIELKSSNVTATLGDIDVNFSKKEFLNFSRKIQGAKGKAEFNFGDFFVAGAIVRGRFNTNRFNGIDGVQGPYRLLGINNETGILVLAGTERVFLDGVRMTRGEQDDYTIDYGIGEVTFTPRRLITNASRIVVEFEYSDRKYSRTLIAGNNQLNLLSNKLNLEFSYVNEFDSRDKTIDFTLSEEDKNILSQAGDNPLGAVKSGVSFVGQDSVGVGKGYYAKVDTLVNGQTMTVYKYQPGTPQAQYQVFFSFIGQGRGNYTKQTSFQYDFAGINQGNYDTLIFLPAPTRYQVGGANLIYTPFKDKALYVKVESAYSMYDANLFSGGDDADNGGLAFNGTIGYTKSDANLFGMKVKGIDFYVRQRTVNRLFTPLERINYIEFNRLYDIKDSVQATENLTEGNLKILPSNLLELNGSFGQLKRGDFFNSFRSNATVEFRGDSVSLPTGKYIVELTNSKYAPDNTKGNWLKQYGLLEYKRNFVAESRVVISSQYFGEYRRENFESTITGDSLRFGSFAFNEVRPRVALENLFGFNVFSEINFRDDNITDKGILRDESKSFIQYYGLSYSGLSWLNTNFDITFRDRYYTDYFKQLGNTDNRSVLVNSLTRISPLSGAVQTDLFYRVTSERTAKIERQFQFVGRGFGNYIWTDRNGNGIQEEDEFELTNFDGEYIRLNVPTDQLFPVVDLNTSIRVTLNPSRYFGSVKGFMGEILKSFTTESYYRIDEKSKDPFTNNIYYIKLSTFQNDTNTLQGTQLFQQDVNLFESSPVYSLRLRYVQQKGFAQYSSGNERLLNIQKSARFRVGLLSDVSTQVEYINRIDRNNAPGNTIRNRNINANVLNTDISYRPIKEIESGIQLNFTRSTDTYPASPVNADVNQQILRFVYQLATTGRLRIEAERDEVILSRSDLLIPYELTQGRVNGKSYFWRAFFDYSLSRNIQASMSYDGRIEGTSSRAIHTGRAEVKVNF